MNHDTIQQSSNFISTLVKAMPWLGPSLTALVVLFLIFDGVTKVMKVKPVMEACEKMHISPEMAVGIGLLLLACTAIHVIPRTAFLGAILLTGYLGGAVATHLIGRSTAFPTIFPVGFAALMWAGLILREPRLLRWILLRE